MTRLCFHCQFFSPFGKDGADLTEADWNFGELEGFCQRQPPEPGEMLEDERGEKYTACSSYPEVFACDWCGEFRKRVVVPYRGPEEAFGVTSTIVCL